MKQFYAARPAILRVLPRGDTDAARRVPIRYSIPTQPLTESNRRAES
jgi:hypothetical protein